MNYRGTRKNCPTPTIDQVAEVQHHHILHAGKNIGTANYLNYCMDHPLTPFPMAAVGVLLRFISKASLGSRRARRTNS